MPLSLLHRLRTPRPLSPCPPPPPLPEPLTRSGPAATPASSDDQLLDLGPHAQARVRGHRRRVAGRARLSG